MQWRHGGIVTIPHIPLHSAWPSSWAPLMIVLYYYWRSSIFSGTIEGARWGQAYQSLECIVQRGGDSYIQVSAPLRGLLRMTMWGFAEKISTKQHSARKGLESIEISMITLDHSDGLLMENSFAYRCNSFN